MVLRTLRANADDDLTTEALFLVKAKAAPLHAIRATPADTGNFMIIIMMYAIKLRVNNNGSNHLIIHTPRTPSISKVEKNINVCEM